MSSERLTAAKAAYRLTHVLDHFSAAHGVPRFPVDVPALARECSSVFHWSDSIVEVRGESIPGFEGALIPSPSGKSWLLLYNDLITSPGRVRFTMAHELGHYILHRRQHPIRCDEAAMTTHDHDGGSIEAEANAFAATLLMPLNDLRQQIREKVCFDQLGDLADRYGVSLTAATAAWISCAEIPVVMIVHRDGFMDWAWSSRKAMKAGAYFSARRSPEPIPIPDMSLAADQDVEHERSGRAVQASIWFPNAPSHVTVRELKVTATSYETVITLLVLPHGLEAWPPRDNRDSE